MSEEEGSERISNDVFWKRLAVRYWWVVLIFALLLVGVIIGLGLTLDLYIRTSTIGGGGTWTFDQFHMIDVILWCIFLILWELLIVGLPTLAVAGTFVGILWFVVLPDDVKAEIKERNKKEEEKAKKHRGKKAGGGGGFGFLLFLGVLIKMTIEGTMDTRFGYLNYRYFIDSYVTVIIWILIIIGIPLAIIAIIWFVRKYGRET